jgi:hypothetical protein
MAKIIIVGGVWEKGGGRPSKVVENLALGVGSASVYPTVQTFNGGDFNGIHNVPLANTDVVIWMPNVDNAYEKAHDVKKSFPKIILVTSKNNYRPGNKYSFQDLVAHALMLKSNLLLEITMEHNLYYGRIIDPLGNVWMEKSDDFKALGKCIAERTDQLRQITRVPTVQSPEMTNPITPSKELDEFIAIIQESSDTFHKLIEPAKSVTRFLGNASFRCMNGFPSFKTATGDIYMSRRNVDKNGIDISKFVQVGFNPKTKVRWYRGDHKPSVDTAIQLRIYERLTQMRYMIHSHVYVKGAPYTKNMIPCGGMEEVGEIFCGLHHMHRHDFKAIAINLVGHGSLIMATEPKLLRRFKYFARPVPEKQIP